MTSQSLRALVAAGLLFLGVGLILVFEATREAKQMARYGSLPRGVNKLALMIELYRDEHDAYPLSLETALRALTPQQKQSLEQDRTLNNPFGTTYEYRARSNGFTITAKSPDRWFGKGKTLERTFAQGEALK